MREKKEPLHIDVLFKCPTCAQEVKVHFVEEQVVTVRCESCRQGYTLMRPTIGQEILLDWEQEALFQKMRAEKKEQDNTEMMALLIKIVELLTWKDEGRGQIQAIEAARSWLSHTDKSNVVHELLHIISEQEGKKGFRL